MQFHIETPSRAYVESATSEDWQFLTKALSYTNTAAQHDVKRHYANAWLKRKNKDAWQAKLDELKEKVHKTLIFEEDGRKFIRPGSLAYLGIAETDIKNSVKYPTPKKVPWAKPLPFELHDYQAISAEELVKARHANVELCTGAGKSAILLKVCRETGFRTAIVAPSESIFNELVEKFEEHLGRGNVGMFGDGKKKIGKRFTICISDSIANIKPGTPEWEFFSGLDMLCTDESHTWGADSLEEICHGVLANIPYRLYYSGTQTRGDGTEKLLQSIIGQTVHRLSTKDAIKGGYICDHNFTIIDVESSNPNYNAKDPLEMKRIHFLGNRNIAAVAAKIANADALVNGKQTLILVEQLNQIAMLLPLLKVPYAYAHSEKNAKKLEPIGLVKVDKKESVEKFNKNEVKVLIGTSCIATGTNIFPTHNTINWVGGGSEIKTKQGAVGRSVRHGKSNPYAHLCVPKLVSKIFDFNVYDIPELDKSLKERILCYRESGTEIKRITINGQTKTASGIR